MSQPQLTLGNPTLQGGEKAGASLKAIVAVGPQGGPENASSVSTTQRPTNPWDTQLIWTSAEGLTKGDVLLATFWMRCAKGQVETGEGQSAFVCERGEAPWTKSVDINLEVPRTWKRFDVPFVAVEDLPAGKVHFNFRLGYAAQALVIAKLTVLNYGPNGDLKKLPRTKGTYRGMEPGAPWRAAAEARIEKLRKAELTVRVVGANGKPIPGAQVQVELTRHGFPLGSAVAAQALLAPGPEGDRYRTYVEQNFSRIVLENDLKWPQWEENGKTLAPQAIRWCQERGISVRGHNLVWPSWRWLPSDLPGLKDNKAALAQRIDRHINDVARACQGQLVDWDVVNEPYANHDLMDILGKDALVHWFDLARKADPKARLFLNDYPPLDGADSGNPHLNHFYETLSWLQKRGAALDGLGFQCHFGGTPIAPERLLSGLDRFAKLKLRIAITELDINTKDEALQAAYLRDFLIAAFSHPAVDSILMWGFWEGRHWLPDAALLRRDWSVKPSGKAWQELVLGTWKTRAAGSTSALGVFKARGFHGQYRVTVTTGKQTKTTTAILGKAGGTVTVSL